MLGLDSCLREVGNSPVRTAELRFGEAIFRPAGRRHREPGLHPFPDVEPRSQPRAKHERSDELAMKEHGLRGASVPESTSQDEILVHPVGSANKVGASEVVLAPVAQRLCRGENEAD